MQVLFSVIAALPPLSGSCAYKAFRMSKKKRVGNMHLCVAFCTFSVSLLFLHSAGPSLSEEHCRKIYTAAAQAAVMEDKCGVHAGCLDSDGSVCKICFWAEFLSELPELYLLPFKPKIVYFCRMAQWSFMGLCHSFYDIVTYTAGYFRSFYRDENKSHPFWNERQFMKRHLLLRCLFQKRLISAPEVESNESASLRKRCFSLWAFTG